MRYVAIGLCMLATACGGESPTAPSSAVPDLGSFSVPLQAKRGSELPFRGSLEASETVSGPLHHLTGIGEATHLGKFTLTSDFTVTGPPPTASGTATWTAANGDQLFATVAGSGSLQFPTLSIGETHTITGGTGRFEDAWGVLHVARSLNVQTLVSTASIEGTMSLGH